MFVLVFFLVPETKGRTLEGMDDVFGSAYSSHEERASEVEIELGRFRREREVIGKARGKDEEIGGVVAADSGDKGVMSGLEFVGKAV